MVARAACQRASPIFPPSVLSDLLPWNRVLAELVVDAARSFSSLSRAHPVAAAFMAVPTIRRKAQAASLLQETHVRSVRRPCVSCRARYFPLEPDEQGQAVGGLMVSPKDLASSVSTGEAFYFSNGAQSRLLRSPARSGSRRQSLPCIYRLRPSVRSRPTTP